MYRDLRQMELFQFHHPFESKLDPNSRWVKWAEFIPWEQLEPQYAQFFSESGMGAPAKSFRMALGILIIQGVLGSSDRETIEQVKENPYLQYFLGLTEYSYQAPFDASMLVHFRKRLGEDLVKQMNVLITKTALDQKHQGKTPAQSESPSQPVIGPNEGKLLVDATCVPADIAYPTDLNLLNDAREKTEGMIDTLHAPLKGKRLKPRDHRKKARKAYLKAAKNKNLSNNKRQIAIAQQLRFLKRNLGHIAKLAGRVGLLTLSSKQYRELFVINELFRQQECMFINKEHAIEDRIVSISQPHVRPIVRGKAAAKTEFGAKISASLENGFLHLHRISWDNFNESTDLKTQIQAYKLRNGFYPQSVHADKIYRNRTNRAYCKQHGIRLSGPPLGRPRIHAPEDSQLAKQNKALQRQDEIDRIPIEGKFGQTKRAYGLNRILAKLPETSACMISLAFLIVNLVKWLKSLFFVSFLHSVVCFIWQKFVSKIQLAFRMTSVEELFLNRKLAL
jgi:transposase, IS5 family